MGDSPDAAANDVARDVRRSGEQLATGVGWTRAEVDKGLRSLEAGIEQLGHDIDTNAHRAANKVKPS